jgi:RNA polymerase sigma-70 factor (ECF subfamily)
VKGEQGVDEKALADRISHISTCWSLVFQAHRGQPGSVQPAQQLLMERYSGAVYRYLLGALRNSDAADDVAQEFALRFVRGDFKQANPDRGRFRDFIKTALFHLVIDYHRKQKARCQPLLTDASELAVEDSMAADAEFLKRWREELLNRTWDALSAIEKTTGQVFYTVLRYRAEHPDARSGRIAEQLGARLDKPLTDAGVRQTLHRAREKFAELLVDEVRLSLQTQDPHRVEQELIDLDLLPYCRSAFERSTRRGG